MSGVEEAKEDGSARFSAGETVAGRYRIERLIGRGGMGDVYAAEHLLTGQRVALKVVRRSGEEARRRLLREAKAASRLTSEHTARVLDADTLPTGDPFLVLELLSGQDLASVLHARGRLSCADAISYVAQAAQALAEAHALGIVHRDVKPGNLFLLDQPDRAQVKVLDFGIAKIEATSDSSVTITGSVMGSPRYMSPEQIRDPKRVDARTDVWALGVTLHELLTGHAPFEGNYAPALCAMITSDAPRLRIAETPGVPSALTAIVERCLAKDPRDRFASAKELELELRAVAPGDDLVQPPAHGRAARAGGDDTLEPQDTSGRADVRATPAEPRRAVTWGRRSWAIVVGLAAASGVMLWGTRQPIATAPPLPASAPVGAASAVAEISDPPIADARSGPAPAGSARSPAQPSVSAAASARAPSARRTTGPAPIPIVSSSAHGPPDESAVLKDRR